jgi:hypothetical protein
VFVKAQSERKIELLFKAIACTYVPEHREVRDVTLGAPSRQSQSLAHTHTLTTFLPLGNAHLGRPFPATP